MKKMSKTALSVVCGLMMASGVANATPGNKDIKVSVTATVAEHFSVLVDGGQRTDYAMNYKDGSWAKPVEKDVTIDSNIPLRVKLDKSPALTTADDQPVALQGVEVHLANTAGTKNNVDLSTSDQSIKNVIGQSVFKLTMTSTDSSPQPGRYHGDIKLEFSAQP